MLLKKGSLLFISLFILFNNGYSSYQNNQNPDSLLKKAYRSTESSKGLKLARQALFEATRTNNKTVIIKSLNLIAEFYWDLRNYDSTKIYAQKALLEANKYQIDSLKGDSWLYMGMVSYGAGDFEILYGGSINNR